MRCPLWDVLPRDLVGEQVGVDGVESVCSLQESVEVCQFIPGTNKIGPVVRLDAVG